MMSNRGITLIALVFTVAILVILSTATIIFSLQNEGLLYSAYHAKYLTKNAMEEEGKQLNEMDKTYANLIAGMQ